MAAFLKSATLLKIGHRRSILDLSRFYFRLPTASTSKILIDNSHKSIRLRQFCSATDQKSAGGKSESAKKKDADTKGLDRRRSDEGTSIVEQIFSEEERRPTTVVEKVKETTKDVTYFGVILAGIVVTGALFYYLFRELWSSKSPGGVYKNAFKMIKAHPEAVEALGEPVKAYGETTRRGRRRHPANLEFVQDGVNCMRMKFYVEGSLRKGSANLEVREDESGNYQYRYLFVQLDGQPSSTIVIADGR